jgi:pilus assembly protein CpaE
VEKPTIYLDGVAPADQATLLGSLSDLQLVPIARDAAKGSSLKPALAVITLERDPDAAFGVVATLSSAGTRVAVVAPSEDSGLVLRALRAGAREFVIGGDPLRLEAAVRNLARPVSAGAAGRVTAVFAPKGGVGATTLTVNLAAVIAGRSERACAVDLDLQLGDVLSSLDITGGYTVSDVLANIRRLDRELMDASLTRHKSGVAVLAQSERIEEAEQIDSAAVGRLLSFMRQHYGHLLLDGLRAFDEVGLAALDASDRILLVVTQQVPAVRNAQRCMGVFRKLGYSDSKVQVVVNRFQRSSNISIELIAETIGIPVLATISNDYATLQRAMNEGSTAGDVAPRSAVARDIAALADGIAGASTQRPRGMLGRLFQRSEAHGAR